MTQHSSQGVSATPSPMQRVAALQFGQQRTRVTSLIHSALVTGLHRFASLAAAAFDVLEQQAVVVARSADIDRLRGAVNSIRTDWVSVWESEQYAEAFQNLWSRTIGDDFIETRDDLHRELISWFPQADDHLQGYFNAVVDNEQMRELERLGAMIEAGPLPPDLSLSFIQVAALQTTEQRDPEGVTPIWDEVGTVKAVPKFRCVDEPAVQMSDGPHWLRLCEALWRRCQLDTMPSIDRPEVWSTDFARSTADQLLHGAIASIETGEDDVDPAELNVRATSSGWHEEPPPVNHRCCFRLDGIHRLKELLRYLDITRNTLCDWNKQARVWVQQSGGQRFEIWLASQEARDEAQNRLRQASDAET